MSAKVSVIIPNYNHAAYLEQRINSVLAQTYRDFEVIILDDCSPDNSRELIEQFRGHPFVSKIIYNTLNSGSTFKQWEKGIDAASGDYIWIAESDDWCEPTLLETLVNGMLSNENIGIAFCQSCYFYEPNRVQSYTYYPLYEDVVDGNAFIKNYMLKGNKIVNASMTIWKKSLFQNIDKEFTKFKFCGDWLFWISILQQSNVFVSGRVLNYFRKHDKDVSSKFYSTGNNYIENIKLYEILHDRAIIDKRLLKTLVRGQYYLFLEMKESIDKNNLDKIYKAFDQHLHLSQPVKLYHATFLKLYFLKQFFSGKQQE